MNNHKNSTGCLKTSKTVYKKHKMQYTLVSLNKRHRVVYQIILKRLFCTKIYRHLGQKTQICTILQNKLSVDGGV